ncbi:MAG: HAD family hydrolase [Candidatus Nanohaloarchaeota archaeon QJJ-5]|nr:HAD family hydrolase [Candidatus Nanohaloarchaeota archaeon QJJ-5]
MSRHDAVIFDNDGVLIPPPGHDMLETVVSEVLERFDIPPQRDTKEPLLAGEYDSLKALATRHGVAPGVLWRERERICHERQAQAMGTDDRTPYDDLDALEHIGNGRPLGIVSNNQHQTIELLVKHFGLSDTFDTWYGAEPTIKGLQRRKPNSYYLEQAIDDLDASRPLYIGDSESDIRAAKAAGADVFFLRRQHRQNYHLSVTPDREIASLDEVLRYS